MAELLFSSWGGNILDNRGGKERAQAPAEKEVSLPAEFEEGRPIKAFMGWDGLVLADESVNVVELARGYMEAVQEEGSCGECFPCRVGTKLMLDLLTRIVSGKGKPGDIEKLERIARDVSATSKCQIGQTSPIPVLHTLQYFRDAYEALIESGTTVERMELLRKVTAPCQDACPAHLDVPSYVEYVKKMRYADSLSLIRQDNALPGVCGRVCVRPCESHCRRANVDEPISIKYLKRFVADYELKHHAAPALKAGEKKDGAVAVIGAGPGGLACAFNLAQIGYPVTIFEALPEPGGMAAVGIPDYRLPRHILGREVEIIENLGVEIRYNVCIGKDIAFEDLAGKMGYKAVFIAVGAHNSNKMRVEGEDAGYEGFVHGVHFLRDLNLGKPVFMAKRMVVVGGGNVAIDCVRCALRKGYKDVNLVYRRSRKEMPADDVEIEDAEAEGIQFHFLTNPTKILAESGKVVGMELIRMELGEPDASGRRRPVPIEGSEFNMEFDAVVPAIGQAPDLSFIGEDQGLGVTKWSTVEADPITLQTAVPHVFVGGDCYTGPDTLIGAIAAGNRAAIAIDKYLRGEPVRPTDPQLLDRVVNSVGTYDPEELVGIVRGISRQGMKHLPVDTRIHNFEEVEFGLTAQAALTEAQRCLRCYRVAVVGL